MWVVTLTKQERNNNIERTASGAVFDTLGFKRDNHVLLTLVSIVVAAVAVDRLAIICSSAAFGNLLQ